MRILYSFFILCFFVSSTLLAQTQISESGFNNWDTAPSGGWEEPSGGMWATPNATIDAVPVFPPPPPTTKTTDAIEGNFAARMETGEIFSILAPGTLFVGEFEVNFTNPIESAKFGKPFTDMPLRMTGSYKYQPIGGDSCDIYAVLWEWNTTTNSRDTIATCRLPIVDNKTPVTTYTAFDLPFTYRNGNTPDSMTIVFTSSFAGDQFEGQVGSTLFIDDVKLEYVNGLFATLMPEVDVNVFPNPSSEIATFEIAEILEDNRLELFDAQGKLVYSDVVTDQVHTVDIRQYPSGTFYYSYTSQGRVINSGTLQKQ